MRIILLSGGSGKRLWPLSNDIRSKQFIKIFKTDNGNYESMLQRVYKQIRKIFKDIPITIATSKSQVSTIYNQIGNKIEICVEPYRKDTFPAIALATMYLKDIKKVPYDEVIVVCPVDPYVEDDFFIYLKKLVDLVENEETNIALMGVEPSYPSEKYGYIIPQKSDLISNVKMFKEKPNESNAEKYIAQGALWNGGVFAFKLKYVVEKAHKLIDFIDYADLYEKYNTINPISFDYAVVEKEHNIRVLRFSGKWKDLGTWNTLTEEMEENSVGWGVILDDTCCNVHVINELHMPILCMGLKNIVVSASMEGILVSDKLTSCFIKSHIDSINQEIMFAEKSWGTYNVIDSDQESMTIKIELKAGASMNYHSHEYRDEIWTIVGGCGKTIVDESEKYVKSGDVITIRAGQKHTILADSELKIIEVQLGKDIDVRDKKKFKLKI